MGTLLRLRCNGLDWLSEPIRRAVISPLNDDWEHKRSKPSERGRWPDRSSLSMRVKNVGRESELLTWERWSESLGSRWFLQRSRDRCSFKTIHPSPQIDRIQRQIAKRFSASALIVLWLLACDLSMRYDVWLQNPDKCVTATGAWLASSWPTSFSVVLRGDLGEWTQMFARPDRTWCDVGLLQDRHQYAHDLFKPQRDRQRSRHYHSSCHREHISHRNAKCNT